MVIGVSCPGGLARQFRVQVSSGETSSRWRLVGSFRDAHEAGQCAARLQIAGEQSRIVECRALPTAA
jgi:cell division protein FtsN